MKMFPMSPPPLAPIIDAADILSEDDIAKIKTARNIVRRQYPQFRWRICSVCLPPDTSLSLFGFWLLNACPLQERETAGERAWAVLLIINAATGQAAVIPGYAAEPVLTDDEWQTALAAMAGAWRARKPAEAIIQFFKASNRQLNHAWKRHHARRSSR